jgi:hypothetical protein
LNGFAYGMGLHFDLLTSALSFSICCNVSANFCSAARHPLFPNGINGLLLGAEAFTMDGVFFIHQLKVLVLVD